MELDNSETIAKNNSEDTSNRPTLPETNCEGDSSEDANCQTPEGMSSDMMQGGPMGGGFRGDLATTTVAGGGNEWQVPMTATAIISGVIILSAVAICLTIWFSRKK